MLTSMECPTTSLVVKEEGRGRREGEEQEERRRESHFPLAFDGHADDSTSIATITLATFASKKVIGFKIVPRRPNGTPSVKLNELPEDQEQRRGSLFNVRPH